MHDTQDLRPGEAASPDFSRRMQFEFRLSQSATGRQGFVAPASRRQFFSAIGSQKLPARRRRYETPPSTTKYVTNDSRGVGIVTHVTANCVVRHEGQGARK